MQRRLSRSNLILRPERFVLMSRLLASNPIKLLGSDHRASFVTVSILAARKLAKIEELADLARESVIADATRKADAILRRIDRKVE